MRMKLKRIYIDQFGKHEAFLLILDDGFNLISGPNESGKSTLLHFILAMFYGFDTYNRAQVERNDRLKYTPWNGSRFGGYINFEYKGINYRLERSFGETRAKDKISLSDEDSAKEIKISNRIEPGEFLFNLKRSEFLNTVYIGQLSTVFEKDEDIREKLMALSGGQALDASIYSIRETLEAKRKLLSPARSKGVLQTQAEKIKTLEKEKAETMDLAKRLHAKREAIDKYTKERLFLENHIAQLTKEQWLRQYEEEESQILAIKEQSQKIENLNEELRLLLDAFGLETVEALDDKNMLDEGEKFLDEWEDIEEEYFRTQNLLRLADENISQDSSHEKLQEEHQLWSQFAEARKRYLEENHILENLTREEKQQFEDSKRQKQEALSALELAHERDNQKAKDERYKLEKLLESSLSDLKRLGEEDERNKNVLQQTVEECKVNYEQADVLLKELKSELALEEEKYEATKEAISNVDNQIQKAMGFIGDFEERSSKIDENIERLEANRVSDLAKIDAQEKEELTHIKERRVKVASKGAFSYGFLIGILLLILGFIVILLDQAPQYVGLVTIALGFVFLIWGLIDIAKRFKLIQEQGNILKELELIEAKFIRERQVVDATYKQKLANEHDTLANTKTQISNERASHSSLLATKKARQENLYALRSRIESLNSRIKERQVKVSELLEAYKEADRALEAFIPQVKDEVEEAYLKEQEALKKGIESLDQSELVRIEKVQHELQFQGQALKDSSYIESEQIKNMREELKEALLSLSEAHRLLKPGEELNMESLRDELEVEINQNLRNLESKLHKQESAQLEKQKLQTSFEAISTTKSAFERQEREGITKTLQDSGSLAQAKTIFKQTRDEIAAIKTLETKRQLSEESLENILAGENLEDKIARHKAKEAAFKKNSLEFTRIELDHENLKQIIEENRASLIQINAEIASIQGELRNAMSSTRVLQEIDEELNRAITAYKKTEEEVADYDLAIDVINAVDDALQKSFGPQINQKATDILAAITDAEEQKLFIDEDFKARLEDSNSKMLKDSAYFSAGKVDQIYLAMRLAIALSLYKTEDGEALPFIFDDSLVQYDKGRSKATLQFLQNLTSEENRQIIFTTCHDTYEEYLEDVNIIKMQNLS